MSSDAPTDTTEQLAEYLRLHPDASAPGVIGATGAPDLDVDEWRRILEAVDADAPPALELAEQLADAVAVDVADAQDAVYDAVDEGVLVEGDAGAFGGIRLGDETTDPSDSDDIEGRGAGFSTDDPQGETRESGGELDKYRGVYLDAVERAGREPWELVEEEALREALAKADERHRAITIWQGTPTPRSDVVDAGGDGDE